MASYDVASNVWRALPVAMKWSSRLHASSGAAHVSPGRAGSEDSAHFHLDSGVRWSMHDSGAYRLHAGHVGVIWGSEM
jgi:uncharacterized protein YycO